jgi:putative transposase
MAIARLPFPWKEDFFMAIKNDGASSLAHTRWDCKYRIVFTPKYRRKAIYAKLRTDIGKRIRRLCESKGVEIIGAHAMPDHIRMLVRIPPKTGASSFMGYLKGKTSLMIFGEHADPKCNYGSRHFWSEGYHVSTAGLNKTTVQNYIRSQELEGQVEDGKRLKEYKDPFTGRQGRQRQLGSRQRGPLSALPASSLIGIREKPPLEEVDFYSFAGLALAVPFEMVLFLIVVVIVEELFHQAFLNLVLREFF